MEEVEMHEGLEDKRELDLQAPIHERGKPEISELSQKGYLYLKENRIVDAKECFEKIIGIEPENNYALVGLGDAARKQGKHQDAIRYYEKMPSISPGQQLRPSSVSPTAIKRFNASPKPSRFGSSTSSTMKKTSRSSPGSLTPIGRFVT